MGVCASYINDVFDMSLLEGGDNPGGRVLFVN